MSYTKNMPVLLFTFIGILTGLACLFVIEACSMFPGNEKFERNIEFTVLVHQFYGRGWYYAMILILYGSLQSTNIASIVFDNILIKIIGTTCGYSISPVSGLICVTSSGTGNSPFGDSTMLFTLGFFVTMLLIIPLTNVDINDNVLLQLTMFLFTLIVQGASDGFNASLLPAVGSDQSGVVGNVLFNFAMANEIPSWVNVTHPRVSIHKSIWYSILISGIFYVFIGIFGNCALSFDFKSGINLLQAMFNDAHLSKSSFGWIVFIYAFFPVMMYATSIPIAMIVVKMNFLAAHLCSPGMATFWAVIMPFLCSIPLQTGTSVTTFGTYTSVSFQAICNFIAPFLIFLFLSKRNMVLAQSVIDELEFLDITAGIKKGYNDDDDDFDYIYHLPYADPSRIIPRDPFKKEKEKDGEKDKGDNAAPAKTKSIGELSTASKHSIKAIRSMLDPTAGQRNSRQRQRTSLVPRGPSANTSHVSLAINGGASNAGMSASRFGSIANLGTTTGTGHFSSRGSESRAGSNRGGRSSVSGSHSRAADLYAGKRRASDVMGFNATDYSGSDTYPLVSTGNDRIKFFHALPNWVRRHVRSHWVALFGLVSMALMIVQVIIANAK
nr:hypothetical protein HK105_006101 [Polyrhizophydium stewartii]